MEPIEALTAWAERHSAAVLDALDEADGFRARSSAA
jgi:hypothetical protein